MSERLVFEIPEELQWARAIYTTVIGGRWEWFGSQHEAENYRPRWPLSESMLEDGTPLNEPNERIRQWLLGQLDEVNGGAIAIDGSNRGKGGAVTLTAKPEPAKDLTEIMLDPKGQDGKADSQGCAEDSGPEQRRLSQTNSCPGGAKKHVWIELPLKRVIHNCPMAPCEMTAARTLAWAEEWRRKEAALREFKRNRREWPRCCGDECEVEYEIGDAAVVVRCKHE